jgi:hypothetical protein
LPNSNATRFEFSKFDKPLKNADKWQRVPPKKLENMHPGYNMNS